MAKTSGTSGAELRNWRAARGWDRRELADRLREASANGQVAARRGLQRMIRTWEVGEHEISERYELLYRQLGYPEVTVDASNIRWLAARERRSRRLIWVTIVSVTLDIALSVVVVIFGIQLHQTAVTSANLCRSSNVSRAEQIQLWDYILGLSPPPRTAAGRAQADRFRAHVAVLFAPRNCADVNPESP